MIKWLLVIPLVLFAGLASMFYFGMYRDGQGELRSVFIDRPAPVVPGTGLQGVPMLTDADLRTGKVTVVNFWATWCPPCRAEHPVLLKMASDGVRVAGINIMDDDLKALEYLADEGNPFFAVATDPKGRNRVEWGVTAPPETFIIRGDGTVAFKFVGPLIGTDYEARFVPALAAALAAEK
ncbi:MAG: DsbE family thiol:disulfide interchange protein [Tabrizicola sp.]|uniref:DsbE family thiol:disulfide interchange protein n=1 Tax=Tabrizicola sp. TaxID=2005166 RepID=UPI002733C58B|nr:DsbE family thiol:disulfide interchange protein [Tabrizicola sp.]MDP3265001.1 DsbE family thiol:disulfide interchange protein [Tabrizicola sp.]MDP3647456.1 DsbE family thiol:disulfide interchange protein [Paracoccaceae bacterium]MDZ4068673.1 DsbE family thiol:disulfide interchange protein [Tabrizicola sp.]